MGVPNKIDSFTIYYGDGTTVSGQSIGQWSNAKDTDVQVVGFTYKDGRLPDVFSGREFYIMYPGVGGLVWYLATSIQDPEQHQHGLNSTKYGGLMPDVHQFLVIRQQAEADFYAS